MNEQVKGGSRKQLIVMITIAAISLGGSYALYYASLSGGTWGTTNKGVFVDPAINAASLELVNRDGASVSGVETWWLWVVQPAGCDSACDDALHQLRQAHILLHREAGRVTRGLVTPTPVDPGELDERYPDLEFLSGPIGELSPGIYIVDPLGNLVLHYPLDAAGKPVLDDLKRLLKVSQIG